MIRPETELHRLRLVLPQPRNAPMDEPPGDDQADPERQADKQASEMKDQLRKEVAMWNALRDETTARQAAELTVPAVAPRAATRPARASRAKAAAAPAAPKSEVGPKKPFSMAFDGVTDAEHITYMIARGRR
jgi:hypothetical protein